jgi:hypothetical protein
MHKHVLSLLIAGLSGAAVAAEPVWFEVASRDTQPPQSFLLPLSQPDHIALARQRLEHGPDSEAGAIVVARIRVGGDGINRNLRSREQRLWSWHVTEFLHFNDLSIELCDGSPSLLEDDPQWFVDNTDGVICFWGYELSAELPAPPRLQPDNAIDGFWHVPGEAGKVFSLDVFEKQGMLGVAWLDFAPDPHGAPGALRQRWLSGAGSIEGDSADVVLGELGASDGPDGRELHPQPAGILQIRFLDCNHAKARHFPHSPGETHFPLERVVHKYDCGPRGGAATDR